MKKDMTLENNSLFNYLPTNYATINYSEDEDALYEIAHNIVICATQFASGVTGIDFEDFDEEREDAISFVLDKIKLFRMKNEVDEYLVNIFDRINIGTPNNFDEISNFICNDISDNLETWTEESVAVGFGKWIERNK